MKVINHQLRNKTCYLPDWKVQYLLVGTFNPQDGESVNYYYGRKKNQTWNLISEIFCSQFDPNSLTFFSLLKKNKIACVDMIDQLEALESRIDRIIGKCYSDTEIINNSVKRVYNTAAIQKIIKTNRDIKVYSTWGKGSKLNDWKKETAKLGQIIPLVSPSLAARVPKGRIKFDYMLDNWNEKIKCNH